jgi:hypothetical protein
MLKVEEVKLPMCLITHHAVKDVWGSGDIAKTIHNLATSFTSENDKTPADRKLPPLLKCSVLQ